MRIICCILSSLMFLGSALLFLHRRNDKKSNTIRNIFDFIFFLNIISLPFVLHKDINIHLVTMTISLAIYNILSITCEKKFSRRTVIIISLLYTILSILSYWKCLSNGFL